MINRTGGSSTSGGGVKVSGYRGRGNGNRAGAGIEASLSAVEGVDVEAFGGFGRRGSRLRRGKKRTSCWTNRCAKKLFRGGGRGVEENEPSRRPGNV